MDERELKISPAHVAYRTVFLAAGLILFGLLFHQLVTLLLAMLMTIIIAIPLAAAAERLERYRIPRPAGALIALVGGIGTLALIIYLLIGPFVDQTNQFVDDVPSIVHNLEDVYADVTGQNSSDVGDTVQSFVELEGEVREPERARLGLAGMRERVGLVGGTLAIESSVGRGTTVRARAVADCEDAQGGVLVENLPDDELPGTLRADRGALFQRAGQPLLFRVAPAPAGPGSPRPAKGLDCAARHRWWSPPGPIPDDAPAGCSSRRPAIRESG